MPPPPVRDPASAVPAAADARADLPFDGFRLCLGGRAPADWGADANPTAEVWATRPTAVDGERRRWLWFSGRMDDADDLRRSLGFDEDVDRAALLVALLRLRGFEGLRRILGPFALALVDESGRLSVVRDPIGGRPVFWARAGGRVLLSTEPTDLLRIPELDRTPDPETLRRWFALDGDLPGGATFHRGLRRVPLGCVQRFDPFPGDPRRLFPVDPGPVERRTDAEHEEALRDRLRQAVECRVRGVAAPAVLLSSGLDSTSVLATLLRMRPAGGVRALFWTLPDHPRADEGPWIRRLVRDLGIEGHEVPSAAWPLRHPEDARPSELGPLVSLYRGTMRAVWRAAREQGWRVLLGGADADHLYGSGVDWWRALSREGRWADLGRGLWTLRLAGRAERAWWVRSVGRAVLGRRRRPSVPGWLTDRRGSEGPAERGAEAWAGRESARAAQARRASCEWTDFGHSFEREELAPYGLEVRRPYRDRRVVDAFLRFPEHLLHRPGEPKRIVRRAMAPALPDYVVRAGRRGLLQSLGADLLRREEATVRAVLGHASADWQSWVRPDWLEERIPELRREGRDGADWVVLWRCVTYELWKDPSLLGSLCEDAGKRQAGRNGRLA